MSDGAGYNARARLARLEALVELQDRLLRQAAARIEALEQQQRQLPPPEPRFIPIAQAAKQAAVSVRTMKRLLQCGAVAGHARRAGTKGRRWLVDAHSLASHLSASVHSHPEKAGAADAPARRSSRDDSPTQTTRFGLPFGPPAPPA
jgi:hypothetical protein